MKVRAKVKPGTPWWQLPPQYLCEECLLCMDNPSVAVMQVRGVELCQHHIDQRNRPVEARLWGDNWDRDPEHRPWELRPAEPVL